MHFEEEDVRCLHEIRPRSTQQANWIWEDNKKQ